VRTPEDIASASLHAWKYTGIKSSYIDMYRKRVRNSRVKLTNHGKRSHGQEKSLKITASLVIIAISLTRKVLAH
jgi:hypothetical protein